MAENIVRFTKEDRSSFSYWFAHWCAFNMTALNLKCWKPKYLLHDIEKPWFKLFLDYSKVQTWHREHNKHHMLYPIIHGKDTGDWEAMIVDWECSHFTKQAAQLNAADEYKRMFDEFELFIERYITSNNKTCEYIVEHDLDTNYCATIFKNAYDNLHIVFNRLGIKHNYRIDYLDKFFNKNC